MAHSQSRFGGVDVMALPPLSKVPWCQSSEPRVRQGTPAWEPLWVLPGLPTLSSAHRMHAEDPRLCGRDCPGL